jgi:hypothetical protein
MTDKKIDIVYRKLYFNRDKKFYSILDDFLTDMKLNPQVEYYNEEEGKKMKRNFGSAETVSMLFKKQGFFQREVSEIEIT